MARDGSQPGGNSTTDLTAADSTTGMESDLTAAESTIRTTDLAALDSTPETTDPGSTGTDSVTAGELAVPPDGDVTTLRVAWTVATQGEVTFVSVLVENETPVARGVRLRNRLGGPVMPPRSAGVPEAGWDDAGYEGVVEPSDRLAVGYACPADAEDPPVTVDDRGRPASDQASPVDAETAVRRLGRATPPRDAVPTDSSIGEMEDPVSPGRGRSERTDREPDREREPAVENGIRDEANRDDANRDKANRDDANRDKANRDDANRDKANRDDAEVPQAIEAWLAGAERRVERGERLSAGSLSAATETLDAAGGVDAVAELPDRLADDARALRALARRASVLATRAEAVDVPVESLRRLA